MRTENDQTLTNTITERPNPYAQPHPKASHPIEAIPITRLYPYATSMREKDRKLITEGLPEGRWYRKSATMPGYTTIQHPSNSRHKGPRKKLVRIPTIVFWRLIAWHEITHQNRIIKHHEYDTRAKDIWEAVTKTKKESGDPKLCWAADITLLDILIDECGCTTELFSNIMNTYHRFTER